MARLPAEPGPSSAAPHQFLDQADFPLDQLADELVPDVGERHLPVLEAVARQFALFKTIKNDAWVVFLRKLQGPAFRTSTSLPPPGGRMMRFFGKATTSSCGLMWDRRKLDLTDAYMWPSGYYAKSDFNLDARGNLLNGRQEALTTIEDIMSANDTCTFYQFGNSEFSPVIGETMPYNELLVEVQATDSLIGIFARSTRVPHLLWAMALQALIGRALPSAGQLPLFVHDPELGVRVFGRRAQSRLITESLSMAPRSAANSSLSRLPLDTRGLGLTQLEQLRLQGSCGITDEALEAIVQSLLHPQEDTCEAASDLVVDGSVKLSQAASATGHNRLAMYAVLAVGLRSAVEANNGFSASALVQRVVPELFVRSEPDVLALHPSSCSMATLSGAEYDEMLEQFHNLAAQVHSPEALVAIGTVISLGEFASGRMLPRIASACEELKCWLDHSSSTLFRLQSWRELRSHRLAEGPEFISFVTHKAVANRTLFYNELLDLLRSEENHDVLQGMSVLRTMVGELHHPCLRLEMLQRVLGLDDKYSLELMNRVVAMALKVISDPQHSQDLTDRKPRSPISAQDASRGPGLQIEMAARRMQGLDIQDEEVWRRW